MSELICETPFLGRYWCPQCDPLADPLNEILDIRRCDRHSTPPEGVEDEKVQRTYLSGTTEAGGDNNRYMCAALHRKDWTGPVDVG